jgi:rRNA maturation RNase YbeY
MQVRVTNAQRTLPVHPTQTRRLVRCAIRALRLRTPGILEVTFIDARRMRALNRRLLGHDRGTDVLSFRYDGAAHRAPSREGHASAAPTVRHDRQSARAQAGRWPRGAGPPIVGELLIAPSVARAYAARHHLPYRQELARYVVHGLLHWTGCEDRTAAQQRRMRAAEDRLLARCGVLAGRRDVEPPGQARGSTAVVLRLASLAQDDPSARYGRHPERRAPGQPVPSEVEGGRGPSRRVGKGTPAPSGG